MNPLLHPYFTKALDLATQAHKDQLDRQDVAYITHPLRVAIRLVENYRKLFEADPTPEIVAAAVLHDVLEDSHYTAQDLLDQGFSEQTVALAKVLTHKPEESYQDYIEEISLNSTPAILIKLADLEDNTQPWRGKKPQKKHLNAIALLNAKLLSRTGVCLEV